MLEDLTTLKADLDAEATFLKHRLQISAGWR